MTFQVPPCRGLKLIMLLINIKKTHLHSHSDARKDLFIPVSIFIFLFLSLHTFHNPNAYGKVNDQKLYDTIVSHRDKHNYEKAFPLSRQFLKQYPKSSLVADVRLVLAEIEQDPQEALAKFRIVRDKYRYFKRRDYVQYSICQIHYFRSQWNNLHTEADRGLRIFKNSSHEDMFLYFRAVASVHLDRFDEAEKDCHRAIDLNHSYNSIARTLLVLSYIYKRTKGYSREYIYNLREIALGFQNADITPTTLYLLGKFYESHHDRDRAYSAFMDVTERYPDSPEANFATRRLEQFKNDNPRRVNYLPDKKTISNTDTLNIQPEIDLSENDEEISKRYYSLSVGPFRSIAEATKIKSMLLNYGAVKTAMLRGTYVIYCGSFPDTEEAIKIKIRLAEELGINANIVLVAGNSGKQYIYGE